MDKNHFETKLEQLMYELTNRTSESMYDFVHLYIRKNNIEVDGKLLTFILDLAKSGIMTKYDDQLTIYKPRINQLVEDYVKEQIEVAKQATTSKR